MYDLVLNDENIFENNPTYVRKTFGTKTNIIKKMFELLEKASENILTNWDVREYIFHNLFRIFQTCPELLENY